MRDKNEPENTMLENAVRRLDNLGKVENMLWTGHFAGYQARDIAAAQDFIDAEIAAARAYLAKLQDEIWSGGDTKPRSGE